MAKVITMHRMALLMKSVLDSYSGNNSTPRKKVLIVIDVDDKENYYTLARNNKVDNTNVFDYSPDDYGLEHAFFQLNLEKLVKDENYDKIVLVHEEDQSIQFEKCKNNSDLCIDFEKRGHDAFTQFSDTYSGFDLGNTILNRQTLDKILAGQSYTKDNTDIHIAGLWGGMCVMKAALHARDLGFEVFLKENTVLWNKCFNWKSNDNQVCVNRTIYAPWEVPTLASQLQNYEELYIGYKGGPGKDIAKRWMKKAGVQLR